ncbi:MAG: glycosyltransferase, partial [Anaeroplasmataceae bacterium]|nr:glycosyltransferase [Anaeroplasmataceae bacterium]
PELRNSDIINLPGKSYPFKELKDYRYTKHPKKILKLIQPYQLDIIHVHTEFGMGKVALNASKKLNIPMIHTLHTMYEDYLQYISPFFDKHFHDVMFNKLVKMFIKKISEASTIEIVPTHKVLEVADKYYMSGDIRVLPTGIDLDEFDGKNFSFEAKENLKRKLNIPNDAFVFSYIGRTSAEKSIPTILNAFAKMKNNENCILLIVGGGPQLEELKNIAKELQIFDKMRFTGLVDFDKISLFYQISNVFVNASKSETQGLTYLEALSSSLPVLVQKDSCILNVVEDYYNGIYFDGEEELAKKMDEILKAPSTLRKIKANTRPSVEQFSKENFCKKMEALYQETIEKNK